MRKIKIYILIDPTNGSVRYVGKTKDPKIRSEFHARKTWNPIFEIIDEVIETEWQFWERFYVSLFRSWGFKLDNQNNGGGGPKFHSLKSRMKMSMAQMGKPSHRKGKKSSDKTREKISKATAGKNNPWFGTKGPMGGKTHSEESKLKTSESCKGKNKGRVYSEKSRKQMSESARNRKNKKQIHIS